MTFNERWGIEVSPAHALGDFRGRILSLLAHSIVEDVWCMDSAVRREYYFRSSRRPTEELAADYYLEHYAGLMRLNPPKIRYDKLGGAAIRQDITQARTPERIAFALECLLGALNLATNDSKSHLIEMIRRTSAESETHIFTFVDDEHSPYFLPLGADILDRELVTRTMAWLSNYPSVREQAIRAFEHYSSGDPKRLRNMLDDLRLSLEALLKLKFGERNMSSQKSYVGQWLNSKGYSSTSVTVYETVFNWYQKFQDAEIKHSERPLASEEVEYVMYLTFTLMYVLR